MKTITIDIDVEGNTTIKVEGVKGKSCKDLTRDIERALGVTKKSTPTAEFHQQAAQQQRTGQ